MEEQEELEFPKTECKCEKPGPFVDDSASGRGIECLMCGHTHTKLTELILGKNFS